jgi:hypothetical protein
MLRDSWPLSVGMLDISPYVRRIDAEARSVGEGQGDSHEGALGGPGLE